MWKKHSGSFNITLKLLLGGCFFSGFLVSACASKPPARQLKSELHQELTVAVLPFSDNSLHPSLKSREMARILTDRISERLVGLPEITLVDRESIEKILLELNLGTRDLVSPEARLRVGRLLGANYFVIGEFSEFLGRLRLDARIVNVETGIVLGSASMEGESAKRQQIADSFTNKMPRLLVSKVSRFSAGELVTSLDHFRKGLALEKANHTEEALKHYQKSVSIDPGNQAAWERMEGLLLLFLE